MPSSRPAVVFLNRFYWPDVAATGQMLTDLAEDLAAAGWDVRVITGRSGYNSDAGAPPRFETHAGVHITRVTGTRFGRGRALGRLSDYFSYIAGAAAALVRAPRGSVFVGMTDPPLLGALALAAAKVRRGRAIYWVQDLFPDVAVSMGAIRAGGAVHRVAQRFASMIYRHADLVIALGPAMAERLVAHGAPAARVRVIHNWADSSAIVPIEPELNPFVVRHGLEGKFVVLYSGNAGRAHVFDALLDAMSGLRDEGDIVFLFIGGGHLMPVIQSKAAERGLRNVKFLDYTPRNELALSLSAASVSIVTEDPRVVGQLVPSKTYGILASGRPAIFIGSESSDVARIIREEGCGRVIDPSDAAGLTDALRELRDLPEVRRSLGRRARHAAETTYSRALSTAAWGTQLDGVVDIAKLK